MLSCSVGRNVTEYIEKKYNNKYSEEIHCKTEMHSSVNVSKQLSCNEVTFVSFCGQLCGRDASLVAVTVELCEELL